MATETTLSGVAAVGKPLVEATVSVRCAGSGTTASTQTSTEGLFQFQQTFAYPCLLLAQGGTVQGAPNTDRLASVAYAKGTANITPLTHLIVARLFGDDPLTVFQAFGSVASTAATSPVNAADMDAVQTFVEQRIIGRLGMSVVGAPSFTTAPFAARSGDAMDGLLELYRSGLSANELNPEQVLSASVSGAGLAAGTLKAPCRPGVRTGFGGTFNDTPVYVPLEYDFSNGGGGDGGSAGGGAGAGAGGAEGQFKNAIVSAVRLDNGQPLGSSAVTDARTGMVSVVRCDYTGALLVTVSGRAGATYYDEALNKDVPFGPEQSIRAIVTDADRNFGITPYTEAAVRYAVQTMAGGGGPGSIGSAQPTGKDAASDLARLRSIPPTTLKDPATDPRKLIGRIVSDQLPGIYRGRSPDGTATIVDLDITRLPVLLNKDNATRANTLPDSPNGVYAAVLAGLVKGAGLFKPVTSTDVSPAVAITEQLASDLADGSLDLRNRDVAIAGADKLTYNFDSLWNSKTVGTADIASIAGNSSLSGRIAPIGNFNFITAGCTGFFLQLDSNGTLRGGVSCNPSVDVIPGVRLVELNGSLGIGIDRRTIYHFFWTDGSGASLNGGRINVESYRLPDSDVRAVTNLIGNGAFRLSDNTYWQFPQASTTAYGSLTSSIFGTAPIRLAVPTTTIALAFEPTAGSGELFIRPENTKRIYAVDNKGDVFRWKDPSQPPVSVGVSNVVSLAAEHSIGVFALTSDGSVYWLNADTRLVRIPNPIFEPLENYAMVDPEAPPLKILGLPRICWLRSVYAISCDTRESWTLNPTVGGYYGNPVAITSIGPPVKLPVPAPIWRIFASPAIFLRDDSGASADPVFAGVDGRSWRADGSAYSVF